MRIAAFLLILMASTVLADDFTTVPWRIKLSDPAPALPPFTEPPKEIRHTQPKAIATVNFNLDERGERMRHAHLASDGKSFRPCNDPKCRVPVPAKLEICPRCKWSVCQCAYQVNGQTPDLPPAPSGTFQSLPAQGHNHHGNACCARAEPPKVRKTILGGGIKICKLRIGAGITAPKRNCGCAECNRQSDPCQPARKTIVGGGVNVLGIGIGAGATWGK